MSDITCEVTKERWRPVPGHLGYDVSDLGRIRSWRGPGRSKHFLSEPLIRKPVADKWGVQRVMVWKKGKYVNIVVHQAVAKAFIGPRPRDREVCHWDGNASNNRLRNLRWGTRSDNAKDAVRHGTSPALKTRKLTLAQAEEIRTRRNRGEKGRALAKEFGVDPAAICLIHRGRTYLR
jgi:hypothetical protein